jgi:hypothetical protein
MAQGMLYPEFQRELTSLLNKHNMDGETNTPDFILAGMLTEQLCAYRTAKDATERWHSSPPQRIPSPVSEAVVNLVNTAEAREV